MSRVRPSRAAGIPGLVAFAILTAPSAGAQSPPLPDVRAFAREVRARLLSDTDLQSQYTFLERREEISVSKLGKVSKGPVKAYEVYPSRPGNTYKRLISVNGVPLSPAELERNDRKHRDDVLRDLKTRQEESPSQQAKRAQREAAERAEQQAVLDEIFTLYDIRLVGRDTIAGHSVVVATLEPRRGYRPRTDAGKLMKKLRARAWVSESEYQVVRVEVEVIDDVTFGWGIVARLHKGSHGVFDRMKVNDEVWLPSRAVFTGTGRALLFRRFSLETVTTYSDYRKFDVKTDESFTKTP